MILLRLLVLLLFELFHLVSRKRLVSFALVVLSIDQALLRHQFLARFLNPVPLLPLPLSFLHFGQLLSLVFGQLDGG